MFLAMFFFFFFSFFEFLQKKKTFKKFAKSFQNKKISKKTSKTCSAHFQESQIYPQVEKPNGRLETCHNTRTLNPQNNPCTQHSNKSPFTVYKKCDIYVLPLIDTKVRAGLKERLGHVLCWPCQAQMMEKMCR